MSCILKSQWNHERVEMVAIRMEEREIGWRRNGEEEERDYYRPGNHYFFFLEMPNMNGRN